MMKMKMRMMVGVVVVAMEEVQEEISADWRTTLEKEHQLEAWQIEAAAVDRSVRILPSVKRIMGSIPKGRYAVATSGAKTYGTCLIVRTCSEQFLILHFSYSIRLHDACRHHTSRGHHHS